MEKIYATLLICGSRNWVSVPDSLKAKVDKILLDKVETGKITKSHYDKIKG